MRGSRVAPDRPAQGLRHRRRAAWNLPHYSLGVHRRTTAVAIADAGRDGQARFLGEIPSSPEALHRLFLRLKVATGG
jgi:hypothetical protein